MKKILALTLGLVILLAATALSASAAASYVTNGLVGRFSGSNFEGSTWKDLSGKNNDITVTINSDNKFQNGAYLNKATKVEFPKALADVVATDEWTLEVQFGSIESTGTSWNTFVNTRTNDNFSLFRHVGNNNLVLKNVRTDGENPRPVAAVGLDDLKNSTVTVTFKVGGDCIIYHNGVEVAKSAPTGAIGANELGFGHDGNDKSHTTEFKGFRFYNRALTAAEVTQNYNADKAAPVETSEPGTTPKTFDGSFIAVALALASITCGVVAVKKVRRF